MKLAPTDGKGTMTKNDKQYFWCPTHKLWQRHKPEDCRKKKAMEAQAEATPADSTPTADKKGHDEALVINTNLTAIAEEIDTLDYDL
jgi:hypothetical protein